MLHAPPCACCQDQYSKPSLSATRFCMDCTASSLAGRVPQRPCLPTSDSGAPTISTAASGKVSRIRRMLLRHCVSAAAGSKRALNASLVPYAKITKSARVCAKSCCQSCRQADHCDNCEPLIPSADTTAPRLPFSTPTAPMSHTLPFGTLNCTGKATSTVICCQPCAAAVSVCLPCPSRSNKAPSPATRRATSCTDCVSADARASAAAKDNVLPACERATTPPKGKSKRLLRISSVCQPF